MYYTTLVNRRVSDKEQIRGKCVHDNNITIRRSTLRSSLGTIAIVRIMPSSSYYIKEDMMNNLSSILLALLSMFVLATAYFAYGDYQASHGDLNHDGTVNLLDLSKLLTDYHNQEVKHD